MQQLRNADLSIQELWLRLQRDILSHALNERLDELDSHEGRAPYSQESEDAGRAHNEGERSQDEPGDDE